MRGVSEVAAVQHMDRRLWRQEGRSPRRGCRRSRFFGAGARPRCYLVRVSGCPPRVDGKGWRMKSPSESENPLRRLEDWEDFVEARYPAPGAKPRENYRNYDN